jgi:peptidoglycan/xylan/chitin deacetylase (PgdA/CDA1 family)
LPIFDENLFGPDIKRFRQEMEWIKKETKILSEDDLIDIIYHNKKFNQMCSMVTFDDGYRDNYDLAFPILKELKIPAMFFIPTYHLVGFGSISY